MLALDYLSPRAHQQPQPLPLFFSLLHPSLPARRCCLHRLQLRRGRVLHLSQLLIDPVC
jgi:hypothetical protein